MLGSLPPHPTPAPHNTRGKHKTAEAATATKLPPCCADATARKDAPTMGVHRAGDGKELNEIPESHTLAVLSGLPQRNHGAMHPDPQRVLTIRTAGTEGINTHYPKCSRAPETDTANQKRMQKIGKAEKQKRRIQIKSRSTKII
ncbi:regulator of sigma E protease [Trypanosoma cruzi]|nr:regulator of sigma E protease [Trypanosoma cruzi]